MRGAPVCCCSGRAIRWRWRGWPSTPPHTHRYTQAPPPPRTPTHPHCARTRAHTHLDGVLQRRHERCVGRVRDAGHQQRRAPLGRQRNAVGGREGARVGDAGGCDDDVAHHVDQVLAQLVHGGLPPDLLATQATCTMRATRMPPQREVSMGACVCGDAMLAAMCRAHDLPASAAGLPVRVPPPRSGQSCATQPVIVHRGAHPDSPCHPPSLPSARGPSPPPKSRPTPPLPSGRLSQAHR